MLTVAILYTVCLVLWGLSFLPQFGLRRSFLLSVCRGIWFLPLLLSFTPAQESKELPRSIVKTPIHVLIDDSESMQGAPLNQAEKVLRNMRAVCKDNSCELKETRLSNENKLTKQGYTPLRQSLTSWFGRLGHEPWVVISDGGDSTPNLPWPREWEGFALNAQKEPMGVLLGLPDNTSERLWIENAIAAPISFEGRPSTLEVLIQRKRKTLRSETVQVQVKESDKVLVSENVFFPEGQNRISSALSVPTLPRGQHELEVRVLVPPGENILWDKSTHVSLDVVSNTVGVLHLLGSPSWDGRFLRRYLKAEPKYDLISFFILRDPWDTQAVDERELSLIPFPVSRLFNEELPKFRTIILQNFNLVQFLAPEYQKNLVEFVKSGGSLLFLGGQRALQTRDLQNSPLQELLPFDLKEKKGNNESWDGSEDVMDRNGPWFDKNLSFTLALAKASPSKLALADVYEEWSLVSEQIKQLTHLKGLHHMELVRFKEEHTPLLDAITPEGKRIPLAVASYPGKGRAIWFFTDQMWRVGMSPQSEISRTVYNHLMESSFLWLTRHDFRKPLSVSRFQLQAWDTQDPVDWTVDIEGPAVHFFEPGKSWHLKVCENTINLYKSTLTRKGPNHAVLSGNLDSGLVKSKTCKLEIRGEGPAFGSVFETVASNVPEMIRDANVGVSEFKMRQLADLTGAQALSLGDFNKTMQFIENWIEERTGHKGQLLPVRFRTVVNHYWIFESWWFFFFLIFLPVEVLIRRWDKLRP